MQDQVRVHGLLERRLERLHELVGQLADEPDRVGHQVVAPLVPVRARRRIERVEQPLPHAHVGVGERVQQRRLAGVRVAGQRDARRVRLVAALAHHAPVALGLLEPPLQLRDAVASETAVGLDLGLTGATGADPAAEPLEVGPQPSHAREVVLELRQLDLEVALGRCGRGRQRCRG